MSDLFSVSEATTTSSSSGMEDHPEEVSVDGSSPMQAATTVAEPLEDETSTPESFESRMTKWRESSHRGWFKGWSLYETPLKEACKLAEGEPRLEFTNRFTQLIQEADFEFGFSTPADEYVRKALDSYGTFAREWINELFLENFNDPFVTCAILRVIAHLEYEQMYPQGMTMAAGVSAHVDAGVRECGVRCFENWENPDALKILQKLSYSEDWLNDYLQRVISDLKGLTRRVASR